MGPRFVSLTSVALGGFFEERHHSLAGAMSSFVDALPDAEHGDIESLGRALGSVHGLYSYLLPESAGGAAVGRGGSKSYVDIRSLVLIREALGYCSPVADAIFAVQGLGSYPIVLSGSDEQRERYLPAVLSGDRIGAFALTETEAGSDVASLRTVAVADGDDWVIDGDKTLISNVGIADYYVLFANADPEKGRKGITAFIVERDAEGLHTEQQPMSIEHPIGSLRLRACRVPDSQRVGAVGEGFKIAMQTLETFRVTVGAAANGMATAALDDSIGHVRQRVQFGKSLGEQQIVQAYLADMATELDAGRLLVARAAYEKDVRGERAAREVAMAKMFATEAAQRIIDRAVQLHGGRGVLRNTRVEALYRDIRPLRIYEGTTEIQKLIIAKTLLR
ncbi:MAG: acyl-CoA dehydrogenase family protein [Polyangiaceae bacterium]